MTNPTTAQKLTAEIGQARETMEYLIKANASLVVRASQERRVNALNAKLRSLAFAS